MLVSMSVYTLTCWFLDWLEYWNDAEEPIGADMARIYLALLIRDDERIAMGIPSIFD